MSSVRERERRRGAGRTSFFGLDAATLARIEAIAPVLSEPTRPRSPIMRRLILAGLAHYESAGEKGGKR